MEFNIWKIFPIFILIVFLSAIIQIIYNFSWKKTRIDLLNIEEQKKIINYNYEYLEIIREREPNFIRGGYGALVPIYNYYIEVYGIKNNKRYLIYKCIETNNEYEELKIFINKFNE